MTQKGHQAFFVGGVVRNKFLKRDSDNLDIATDATPDEVEKILDKAKIKSKTVGKQYGTILTVIDSIPIEITTFRSEGRYSDKRHPDQVNYIDSYIIDAKRRDFTINALYEDPIKKQIYDPTGGLKDIKRKLIKFVGDPKKRIDEDALRMLRGVRLATQLGFKFEKNTFAAIKTRAKYIQEISGERIKTELDKILLSGHPTEGVRLLAEVGLLKFILPELVLLKNVFHKSKKFHLEGSVFEHTMLVVKYLTSKKLELLYAGLFHDIGKVIKPVRVFKHSEWRNSFRGHDKASVEIFLKFATKYKFSKQSRDEISWLIGHHDDWRNFIDTKLKTKIQFVSNPNFLSLLELIRADEAGNLRLNKTDHVSQAREVLYSETRKLLKKIATTKNLQAKLSDGELIMKYSKLKPGRELGVKIQEVKVQIILGKIKTEAQLRTYLRT